MLSLTEEQFLVFFSFLNSHIALFKMFSDWANIICFVLFVKTIHWYVLFGIMQMMSPPQSASRERRTPSRLVLNRLEDINRTVKVCMLSYLGVGLFIELIIFLTPPQYGNTFHSIYHISSQGNQILVVSSCSQALDNNSISLVDVCSISTVWSPWMNGLVFSLVEERCFCLC